MSKRCSRKQAKKTGIQTTLAYSMVDENPNDNSSFPYGLVRTVRHYLDFIGLLSYLRGLKREIKNAPRLDCIVLALIVCILHKSNSMDACARWLEDPQIKKYFGFKSSDNVSQMTIDRAVNILGKHREDILKKLWEGIIGRFEINDYDIAVDGSAVVLHGPKSQMGALGHPRDGKSSDLQVEFTVAVLLELGIPIYIKPFEGNASDERQYREAIPEISSLIQGKGVKALDDYKQKGIALEELATIAKVGATIIADNGAASKENIDRAVKCGNEMVTRVKLNKSDEQIITEHFSEFEELADLKVKCYVHTFESSGRTNYLFFSQDLKALSFKKAKNSIIRGLKEYEDMEKNGIKRSKIVKVHNVPGYNVDYTVTKDPEFDPKVYTEDRICVEAMEKIGPRAGFFKLSSTSKLPPEEALRLYRARNIVEQTISSLKRVTGIKPLRVWGDMAIGGSMVLALMAETALAMARHCVKNTYRSVDRRSKEQKDSYCPSTSKMALELGHLTLTRFKHERGRYDSVMSNWTELSEAIFADIHAHESPDWGSRKVSLPVKQES